MRSRRHFQPMLDSMPFRIAPSAVVGVTHVVVSHITLQTSHMPMMNAGDTEMPETGPSTPTTPTTGSTNGSGS